MNVTETCTCGAGLWIHDIGIIPDRAIADFRAAHAICRTTPTLELISNGEFVHCGDTANHKPHDGCPGTYHSPRIDAP